MKFRQVITLWAAIGLPAVAWAYIPPSEFISAKIAGKHSGYKGLRIRSVVAAMSGDTPTGVSFRNVTEYDFARRVIRSKALDDAGRELYRIDQPMSLSGTPIAAHLLLDSASDALVTSLKAGGVPVIQEKELEQYQTEEERRSVEVSSLGRWRDLVAWVIGASDQDDRRSTKPQLWVQKDQFIPIRLVTKVNGDVHDFRFDDYRYIQEFPWPRMIQVAIDGTTDAEIALREQMVELNVNPDLSGMKAKITPGFTAAGEAADHDVRKLIVEFYQAVR